MSTTAPVPPALRRTLAHWRGVAHGHLGVPRPMGDTGLFYGAALRFAGLVLTLFALPVAWGTPSGLDAFSWRVGELAEGAIAVLCLVFLVVLCWDHVHPGSVARADRWLTRPVHRRGGSRGALLRNTLVASALLGWGSLLHFHLLPTTGQHPLDLRAAFSVTLTIWLGRAWPFLMPWLALSLVQCAVGWWLGGACWRRREVWQPWLGLEFLDDHLQPRLARLPTAPQTAPCDPPPPPPAAPPSSSVSSSSAPAPNLSPPPPVVTSPSSVLR